MSEDRVDNGPWPPCTPPPASWCGAFPTLEECAAEIEAKGAYL